MLDRQYNDGDLLDQTQPLASFESANAPLSYSSPVRDLVRYAGSEDVFKRGRNAFHSEFPMTEPHIVFFIIYIDQVLRRETQTQMLDEELSNHVKQTKLQIEAAKREAIAKSQRISCRGRWM